MIKLFIADDHPIVREGLKRIILDYDDLELVGEASDGKSLLAKCKQIEIDVLLLDISMPDTEFLDLLKNINSKYPNIRILVLSIYPEELYALRALKAGAAGYLTKNHTSAELAEAVRHVHNGNIFVSNEFAKKVALEPHNYKLHDLLSNREYQILCMIGTGIDTGKIAEKLNLSPKTVSTYQSRIMDKMKLESKGELIRYAIKEGLIE